MTNFSLKWLDLLRMLLPLPGPSVVYLLGMSDTGKSTLANYLYEELGRSRPVAYLDADPGQSSIGPPATLGLKIKRPSSEEEKELRFVGSITPHRNHLAHYKAIFSLKKAAIARGAELIIVDSSGYAAGWEAGDFQFAMVEALNPAKLLVLQKTDELKPLLTRIKLETDLSPELLEPSENIRARDPETRQKRREDLFAAYFRCHQFESFEWENCLIWGDWSHAYRFDSGEGALAGLLDIKGSFLGLATVRKIDFEKKCLEMASPVSSLKEVARIHLSNLWLNLDGRHGPLYERLPESP
ncbi:MAG: Clp1/GlmU family protein [Calditrichia bacterium]